MSLYFVRKKGEAVSTGATEKSMPSHGLLDPTEPWRLGGEILLKHSICAGRGVPGLGSINPAGSQLENILRVRHSSYYEPAALPSLDKTVFHPDCIPCHYSVQGHRLEEHRIIKKKTKKKTKKNTAESERLWISHLMSWQLKDRSSNKAAWLHFHSATNCELS